MRSTQGSGFTIDLFGREKALTLIREFTRRPTGGERLPLLVFTGPRGIGKTALLDKMAGELAQEVPYARLDLAEFGGSPVHEILTTLAFELSRNCGGRIAFPRFIVGRLAISLDLPADDRGAVRSSIEHALGEHRRASTLSDFLSGIAPAAGEYSPRLLLKGVTSWRPGRRAMLGGGVEWYGDQPLDTLTTLNLRFRRDGEDDRRTVDERLLAAFLADIEDSGRNCVLLLDDADAPGGRLFLFRFAETRKAGGEADAVSVVTTSRGEFVSLLTTDDAQPTIDTAGVEDWRTRASSAGSWYPVLLPDLTAGEVLTMTRSFRLPGGNERRTAALVHELTHGHPASTRLLLAAIRECPGNADDLRAVLDQPDPDRDADRPDPDGGADRTVRERLWDDFVRGPVADVADDLVTLSAARDRNEAGTLPAEVAMPVGGDQAVLFSPDVWTAGGLPAVLRRLLLERLAGRPDTHPASWERVHGVLCERAEDEAGRLYHTLALGRIDDVAQILRKRTDDLDPRAWLHLLRQVTTAPRHTEPDEPDEPDEHAVPDDWLAELITTLWTLADPLAGDRRRQLHRMAAVAYEAVAASYERGRPILLIQAQEHRDLAEKWKTARRRRPAGSE